MGLIHFIGSTITGRRQTVVETVDAGENQSVGSLDTVQLAGSHTGPSATLWTTSGTGTFNNASILNAVYTPSLADIEARQVTLTLTAGTATDVLDVTITVAARGVAVFDATSGSATLAQAAARTTTLEINTGSGDVAKSWNFWVKGDNLSRLSEEPFSMSNTTREQYAAFWVNSDNTTKPLKFQFAIFGNSTATLSLTIETSIKLLRNRWYMITVTYNANAAASGLELYINGVLDSSASKTEGGAYASAYQTSAMRLKLGGRLAAAAARYGGQLCELSFWNRVLTAGEVATMITKGQPVDVSTLGIYTDCIEYFKLTSSSVGEKGITLADTNMSYPTSKVSTTVKSISFKKASDTNTRYVAFGGMTRSGDLYQNWIREALSHTAQGNLLRSVMDRTNFEADPVNTVVITEPTTSRVSGVAAGNINGTVTVFCAQAEDTGGAFTAEGRYLAADGTVGDSFGSFIDMNLELYPRREFYGKVLQGFAPGEYIVPFFEHNNNVEWRVSIIRTTDNGATYTKHLVTESLTKLAEPAIVKANNRIIMICRNNSGSGLWQIVSDAGDATTWSAIAETNLGTGICDGDMCLDDDGNIVLVFMDRNERGLWISRNNDPAAIIADATAWNTPERIARSYATDSTGIIGYPNILNDGGGKFVITWCGEFSTTRCDLFWGYGDLQQI